MKKMTEKRNLLGRVEFFKDLKRNFFLARPHGIINPSLLREDLENAHRFANECNAPWTYITNTEDVRLVNPFNLAYLKEVKKIKHLKKIVIYAPGFINRWMIRLASFIVQPDLIIKHEDEFQKYLLKVK